MAWEQAFRALRLSGEEKQILTDQNIVFNPALK